MTKRSKYGAIPTYVDGIRFHSKKEAHRYAELLQMEKRGRLHGLKLQPSFPCVINGVKVCTYRADFEYTWTRENEHVVEDVKGHRTAMYRLKKKLVEALYPEVRIFESGSMLPSGNSPSHRRAV